MTRKRAIVTIVAVLMLALPTAVAAEPADGPGTLALTVDAPDGATAMIEVRPVGGDDPAAVVVHESGDPTHEVELEPGNYRVVARPLYLDGVRYVPTTGPWVVRVRAGQTVANDVGYAASLGVQNLQVTEITDTSVSLDWDAELGDDTVVRRVTGDDAATGPSQGNEIPITDSSLTDTGLEPGTTYTYSIFARPGDGAFGRSEHDPVTITVGTVPLEGATDVPAFVLDPRTTILGEGDYLTATPTGTGVRLDLAPGSTIFPPGSFLSVPVSESLPGGYLGEVVGVGSDGTFVLLEAAPLAAAFDLYILSVPSFSELATSTFSTGPAAASSAASPASKEELHRQSREGTGPQTATAQAAATAAPVECGGAGGIDVTSSIGISHDGHANIEIDTYGVWFVQIPTGAAVDVGYTATFSATVDIESTIAVECGLPLDDFYKQLTLYPVPIGLNARFETEVAVSAAGSIENLGFAATLGFEADGYMGLDGDNFFDGNIINTAEPNQPTATGTFGVGLNIAGSVAIGPGVGSSFAGVVVGVGGEVTLVDAGANVVVVDDGTEESACIEFFAQSGLGIFATLRAWIPGYEADYTYSIDALQGEFPWGGSPWFWPDDCTESDDPTDDVVGDGVTVLDSDLSGDSDQWGKVDGFIPGEGTWVLSTGQVQEAVGVPSFFASTSLGQPGDAALTALSGFPTFDAAALTLVLIPNGPTLNVRYAFASEEYPEYVGSSFNDVMAVFVDGQNCALVPGTSTPVSINTVNQFTNSQYYIDNTFGAAGYGTSMDGLTVPLTCSVPVQPGDPVTVKIAVADASDGIYDSAIALLDDGIWSD